MFVILPIAFAPTLLQTQVGIETAALLLVGVNVLRDAFVAGRRLALSFEVAAELLRRPDLENQRFDLLPGFRLDPGGVVVRLTTGLRKVVSLFRAVATPAPVAT